MVDNHHQVFPKRQRLHLNFFKQHAIRGNLETIVCSPGGVGTTFFIKFVAHYKSVNDYQDIDGIKHLDRPPLVINNSLKAIYIYGNPFNIVLSLFRRKFHARQSYKLLRYYKHIEPIQPTCTLIEYLRKDIDKFQLSNHFHYWSQASVNYPIMLIKYETLWQHLPEIFEYLEIPSSEIAKFPTQQSRQSDWDNLTEEEKSLLSQMYGELHQEIHQFEDIKIIEPNKLLRLMLLPKYALYLGAAFKQQIFDQR